MSPKPATEVVLLKLKPGIEDIDASEPWQGTLKTIAAQSGWVQTFYGLAVEDPTLLELIIDWESLEEHKKFIASPQYGPFVEQLNTILAAAPAPHHFYPAEGTSTSILTESNVVECATFYQVEDQASFVANAKEFTEKVEAEARKDGAEGMLYGPVEEDLAQDGEGEKGRAVRFYIGWTSVQAHMNFRKTKAYADNIALLRGGASGAELHHTAFKKF